MSHYKGNMKKTALYTDPLNKENLLKELNKIIEKQTKIEATFEKKLNELPTLEQNIEVFINGFNEGVEESLNEIISSLEGQNLNEISMQIAASNKLKKK